MNNKTLLIKDARIVNEGRTIEGDVLIRAGDYNDYLLST